ncbi:hypothetical protein SAMN05518672_1011620 [Chitinophaga sp. CF118]|uniref:hypothetical protein n=1 Tax=Chitinophaga sp. CF118 TaxID=1884367 RepID=UPI0008F22C44|nr:hypothetical protein [Chitinophaga sp. CF118]SFD32315.1 hypothetical protein SAMN05518672_1011620 [Chitinophaga sp. CF118]
MRCILILLTAALLFSCTQSRDSKNRAAYDIITEKCYVIRNVKPVSGDPLVDSVMQRSAAIVNYLERHGFSKHIAAKDSLLFHRTNAQEVVIELPAPQDVWQANTIIVFDPEKNPLFVNLHKDTTQVEHYIK